MARILLGVSGGISAYKAVELARLAIKAGHAVRVVETEAAERFVGRATFEGITGAPVLAGEFEPDPARGAYPGDPAPGHAPIAHLELVRRADVYVVAPASANTIAKLAAGIADSMLTTSFLACTAPRLVAPAMNDRMYRDAATQANLATLRQRGVTVIEPEEGGLASRGEHGVGRLPEPRTLLDAIEVSVPAPSGPWDGLRVLVSAGGTREPIDPVRFIGNRSSGRMGVALAEEAQRRGARVTLLAANLAVPAPAGVEVVDTPTAADLARAARERASADVVLMAAAVADYAPEPVAGKRAKNGESWELSLHPTEDVLAGLGEAKNGTVLVGFGAEEGDAGLERKRRMLTEKHLDLVVFNDVSRPDIGFDSPENEVVLVSAEGERTVAKAPKERIAAEILDEVERLLERS